MQCVLYERSQALINPSNKHTTIQDEEVRWAYEIPGKVFDFAIAIPISRSCMPARETDVEGITSPCEANPFSSETKPRNENDHLLRLRQLFD